ncbi:ATP-binding cassette domain-containing protein [Enterococcus mundtii]|nr:ATP-binding cassette domain-containing protein [Enterococcus mundtii]
MIKENSYTALVGHTGSGKSTLLQHLNALIKPTEGTVQIGDRQIKPDTDNKNLKPIRKKSVLFFNFQRHSCLKKRSQEILRLAQKTLV